MSKTISDAYFQQQQEEEAHRKVAAYMAQQPQQMAPMTIGPDATEPGSSLGPQTDDAGKWLNGGTHYIKPQVGGPEPAYDDDVRAPGPAHAGPSYIDFFTSHGAPAPNRDAPPNSDEFHAWLKQSTPEEYKAWLAGQHASDAPQAVRPETAAVAVAKKGLASHLKPVLETPHGILVDSTTGKDTWAPDTQLGQYEVPKDLNGHRFTLGENDQPVDLGAILPQQGDVPPDKSVPLAKSGLAKLLEAVNKKHVDLVDPAGRRTHTVINEPYDAPGRYAGGHSYLVPENGQERDLGILPGPAEMAKRQQLLDITQGAAKRARDAALADVQHEQETRQQQAISPYVLDRLASGMPGNADYFEANKKRLASLGKEVPKLEARRGIQAASSAALTKQFLDALHRSK